MPRLISLTGLFVLMAFAWMLSNDRRRMNFRLIVSGIALQFLFAILILWTAPGQLVFSAVNYSITHLIEFSDAGSEFVFGTGFKEHFFAFSVLPTIIFVSSLMTVLFHLGILQKVVEFMAKIMVYVMDASGSESLVNAANIFMGLAEAPLVIRPYIPTMTRSEIMALIVGGMANISGSTLAAYAGLGASAGHLLTSSIISAPAALVIAKIMYPEKEESMTKGVVKVQIPKEDANVLDAACRGATDGTKLAVNVGAMLICFIAFVALFNWLLTFLPAVGGEPLTLERMLGWLCAPLAWVMGVEWKDAGVVGMLIGKKTIMNEFIAYVDLVKYKDVITDRSFTIATYALCGFANFGSVAIQIGGIGTLVPSRREDFAKLGIKAMIGGSLATFMTATVAGILI